MKAVHIQPDLHAPFHNKKAWRLNLKVAEARETAVYISLGDFIDNYSISSHQKNPDKRELLLQDEVDNANERLDELDTILPKARKIFIAGNHEDRLDRYIAHRAPDLFGMVTTAQLLNLKKRGWEYVPYREHIKVGHVYYTHDTGKAGASAHRQAERAFSDNAVIGHTHRMALEIAGNAKGHPHVCGMFGWLGDIAAAEYMHVINARRDWTVGFGTAWLKKDGTTFLAQHPVVNNEVVVDGQLYR